MTGQAYEAPQKGISPRSLASRLKRTTRKFANDEEYEMRLPFPLRHASVVSSLGFELVFLITEILCESGPVDGWRRRRRLVCPNPSFDLAPDQHH